MPFILRWALNGDKAQLDMGTAKEAVQKAQEVMADGAENISITNPVHNGKAVLKSAERA